VHAINPTPEEIAQLEHETGAPIDFITPALDIDERARTDKENGVTLIVLRIPYFQGADADVPYTTMPLGIVLTEQHVMTVCRNENGVMHELLGGRVRGLSTAKRNRFVLHLLLIIAQKYLQYLRQINKAVDALEDQLQRSQKNRELLQLLQHQKSLVYFTTALKSNELVLQRLQRSRLFDMYPDDTDLLEDALTETQQAIEMTNISGNILSQMMDAFASIISNNLNVVMKFLASITIVLSIPTIVASFYGMNVDLPMQNHPLAFAITLAVALGIAFLVVIVFWRKDWF
jgi:magnesium transporter